MFVLSAVCFSSPYFDLGIVQSVCCANSHVCVMGLKFSTSAACGSPVGSLWTREDTWRDRMSHWTELKKDVRVWLSFSISSLLALHGLLYLWLSLWLVCSIVPVLTSEKGSDSKIVQQCVAGASRGRCLPCIHCLLRPLMEVAASAFMAARLTAVSPCDRSSTGSTHPAGGRTGCPQTTWSRLTWRLWRKVGLFWC